MCRRPVFLSFVAWKSHQGGQVETSELISSKEWFNTR
jgi:hypothetical protein